MLTWLRVARVCDFAAEALDHFGGSGLIGEEDLHGLAALGDEVLHLVDNTEPSGAQPCHDFVIANSLPRFKRHER